MWSDSILNAIFVLFIGVIIWVILEYINSAHNLPPGPKGIPFLGYLPFLGNKPHVTLTNLMKKYGDMFTIYVGSERVIVLSSLKLIKEAFLKQGNIYAEKPESIRDMARFDSQEGLFAGYGPPRVLLRRFTLTTLRNFGMGKASLEPKILDEINSLVEEIKKFQGKPAYYYDLLTMSVTNVICTIMYGRRMEYDDKHFQRLIQLSKDFILSITIHRWTFYVPEWFANLFGIKTSLYKGTLLYRMILNEVKKHKNNDVNNRDSFIDAWRTEANQPNSDLEIFNEKRLAQVLTELFIAGSDSTSITLEWTLLYLAKYKNVQSKMQQEIDDVIGKDRCPAMTDQKLMPYTEATLMEINRITSISPLAAPHRTTEDSILNNYNIPKDTTIYPNLWALHNNPEVFPEPEVFRPERFLTDDNKVKRIEDLIPFSLGKRQCPGEALARMEIFLNVTSLLQHFTFTAIDEVDLDCHFAIVLEPKHQKLCATLR